MALNPDVMGHISVQLVFTHQCKLVLTFFLVVVSRFHWVEVLNLLVKYYHSKSSVLLKYAFKSLTAFHLSIEKIWNIFYLHLTDQYFIALSKRSNVLQIRALFPHSSVSGGSLAAILNQRSLQTTTVTSTELYMRKLGQVSCQGAGI